MAELWRQKAHLPKARLFADGEVLRSEVCKYFEWCDTNPRYRTELVKYQGMADDYHVPIKRPYTLQGLTTFLGVSERYFSGSRTQLSAKIAEGKATEIDRGILDVIEWAEQVIRTQHFEGGLTGEYSQQIVARLHGLVDRQDVTSDGEAIMNVSVRDQETADNLRALEDLI